MDEFLKKIREEAQAIVNLNNPLSEKEYGEREERIAERMEQVEKDEAWSERVLRSRDG